MVRRKGLGSVAVGVGLLALLAGGAGAATPLVKASDGPSPFAPGCDGVTADGTNYGNSEVEVRVAVDPRNPAHAIGVWQQDRWSTGGAHGLVAARTVDGVHWT